MDNDKLVIKLNEIKTIVDECLAVLSDKPTNLKRKQLNKNAIKNRTNSADHTLEIVNKIKNCGEADKIEEKILDKVSVPGRILLSFYICYKYFPHQGLTTGDIAKITSELRIGIKTPNVSKTITDSLQKYLEGNSTRVKGKAVIYKLNRKGAKYFESLLNTNEEK